MLFSILKYLDIAGPMAAIIFWQASNRKSIAGSIYLKLLLASQLLTNTLAKILMNLEIPNIQVYQVNALLGFIMVSGWFLHINKESKSIYRGLRIYALFALLLLLVFLFTENAEYLNHLSYTFVSLNICGYCMLFYLFEMNRKDTENPYELNYFMVTSAIFGYYLISFFIFLGYGLFSKQAKDNFQFLWGLHNATLFVSCCLIAVFAKTKATQ